MLFFVKLGEAEHRVRVESRRNRLYVTFDDEPEERVDLVYHGHDCTFIQDLKVFFANVSGAKNDYRVCLPSGNLYFTVESEYKRIVSRLRGQELEQANLITAKMPGKVVKIMVKQGDTVEQGGSVLVMEAMKMENEIRSSIKGKVTKIVTEVGQNVETGALLVELDPVES